MSTHSTMPATLQKTTFGTSAFLSATFWVAATAAFAAAVARSAEPFGAKAFTSYQALMKACDANPNATIFVLVWGAMVIVALSSIIRRVVGVKGTWGASVVVALASLVSLAESFSGGALDANDSDRGALLMIVAALTFAGNSRLWWLVLAPLLAASAIVPVAWLEYWEALETSALIRSAVPAVVAACLASLVVVIRETRARVLEARSGIAEVTHREEVVAKTLVSFSRAVAQTTRGEIVVAAPVGSMEEAIEATASRLKPEDVLSASSQTTTVEIESPETTPASSSSVTYQDLQSLASEALEAVRVKWAGRSDVRLLLTAPMDLSLPIAVRGNNDEVRIWLRSLVENAVDALGGGRGVVRLTLKPTLTHVAIAVEDNGRGLGEDLYRKLGVQDPARIGLADVKAQAAKMGARLDLHSRLGVGTRATLELSRIDALSALSRASRETSPRIQALRMPQDSNSLHA